MKLAELDKALGYLIEKLQAKHLIDRLNVIVTSDHGMEATSLEKSIFLDEFVDISLFQAYGANTIKNVFLKNSNFLIVCILEFNPYSINKIDF